MMQWSMIWLKHLQKLPSCILSKISKYSARVYGTGCFHHTRIWLYQSYKASITLKAMMRLWWIPFKNSRFFYFLFQRNNCGVLWDRNSVPVPIRILSKFSKIVWKNFIIKHFDENFYALSITFSDNDSMYLVSQIKRNRIYICYTLI